MQPRRGGAKTPHPWLASNVPMHSQLPPRLRLRNKPAQQPCSPPTHLTTCSRGHRYGATRKSQHLAANVVYTWDFVVSSTCRAQEAVPAACASLPACAPRDSCYIPPRTRRKPAPACVQAHLMAAASSH
jgi:hypothetical protein